MIRTSLSELVLMLGIELTQGESGLAYLYKGESPEGSLAVVTSLS